MFYSNSLEISILIATIACVNFVGAKMQLSFNKLSVNVAGATILNDINFTILPGGIFNFYGANGIGKTRLLKTIANAGQSKNTLQYQNRPKAASDSVYIGLDSGLYDSFTVLKNLEFIAKLHDNKIAIAAAIHVFELQPYLKNKYKNLSTGWKRKALLATLLLSKEPIWLIDEPFVSLDEHTKKRLIEVIISKASNGGIVMLTNQNEIVHPDITNFNLEERGAI